jgi:hypothetical protein
MLLALVVVVSLTVSLLIPPALVALCLRTMAGPCPTPAASMLDSARHLSDCRTT